MHKRSVRCMLLQDLAAPAPQQWPLTPVSGPRHPPPPSLQTHNRPHHHHPTPTPTPPFSPPHPTAAADLWSLGIVLFVLLSGSHVPFGNRGLCWTSIPNMPGPQESVDRLQRWLEVRWKGAEGGEVGRRQTGAQLRARQSLCCVRQRASTGVCGDSILLWCSLCHRHAFPSRPPGHARCPTPCPALSP